MDQQVKFTTTEILDMPSENYQDIDFDSSSWLSSTLDSQKVKTTENHNVQNNNSNIVPVSAEEMMIRSELELEIERGLEEEIKESMYRLALRLHRIYKQRKERNAKDLASECGNHQLDNNQSRALSLVNISIRMEGGTKVEIRVVNKEVPKGIYKVVNDFGAKKKFDWVKTLREGSSPVSVNRTNIGRSRHKNEHNVFSKCKLDCGRGKSGAKLNASVSNKRHRVVWKV